MLRAADLSHHFGIDLLFGHVDLTLRDGDRVGLVGPNGTGKSTLVAALAGALVPAGGRVLRSPNLQVGYQTQDVRDPRLGVDEYVAAGAAELIDAQADTASLELAMAERPGAETLQGEYARATDRFDLAGGWSGLARIGEVRSRLGIGSDDGVADLRPVATLSGGEQSRVLLARLLVSDPDVLLLDEPTNHLDSEGRRWLGQYLQQFRGAVLVVSHDRRFLDQVVSRVVELDGISPSLQDYPGCAYTAYREERRRRWQRLLLDYEAQEKFRRGLALDIERTKAQARGVEIANPRNPGARRLARKVARKALSRERRLDKMMRSASWLAAPTTRPPLVLHLPEPEPEHEGQVVVDGQGDQVLLEVDDLPVYAGDRMLMRTGPVRLLRGDRIHLRGANGVGKSSLLRALLPRLPGGELLEQTHHDIPPKLSVLDFFRSRVPMYASDAEAVLDAFQLDRVERAQPMGELSSGEVRRVLLAALVNTPTQVLLLDEPTNHLDFDALDVVEAAFGQYSGTLVVVTHDDEFADRIGITAHWDLADETLRTASLDEPNDPMETRT